MKLRGLTWWIDRWRKSTAYTDLTLEEQGAYRNLLDEAWLRDGLLPDDDRILAKACGDANRWHKVKKKVLLRFQKEGNFWRNLTLDSVQNHARHHAERQANYRNRLKTGVTSGVTSGVTNTVTLEGSGSGSDLLIPPTPLTRRAFCPHDPPCSDKRDCAIRKRRAAGL